MDSIDIKILNRLKKNSRENASDIAEKVDLSVSAVIERIKKLEAADIIKQYTIVLNEKGIGKDVRAYISISTDHPKYNENFEKFVLENKNITECSYLAGDFDYLLKVVTDDTEGLERLLNSIKSIPGVSKTKTMLVLSGVKTDYSVEL